MWTPALPAGIAARMKTLFINAAGTANGYFLAETARRFEAPRINLLVGDMGPPHLVAASKLADTFVRTPPVADPGFRASMLDVFERHDVGFYIPLFPEDCVAFPFRENERPLSLSVPAESVALFGDKLVQREMLEEAGIPVEDFFGTLDQALASGRRPEDLVAKPLQGSGSKGMLDGARSPLPRDDAGLFFAGRCGGVERTVDVLSWKGRCWTVTRERLEVKAGVCTKTRAGFCPVHDALARRLCSRFRMPVAFCFQTMAGAGGEPVITDLNPRIGAGSAMSRFAGIDFARNLIGLCLGIFDEPRVDEVSEATVVRVWRDLAMR